MHNDVHSMSSAPGNGRLHRASETVSYSKVLTENSRSAYGCGTVVAEFMFWRPSVSSMHIHMFSIIEKTLAPYVPSVKHQMSRSLTALRAIMDAAVAAHDADALRESVVEILSKDGYEHWSLALYAEATTPEHCTSSVNNHCTKNVPGTTD
jgi:hypothetical protein